MLETTCCIVGGGPCGLMLGYLFARAGLRVTVLEKHADFFRDFRGDTVHPSTLEVLHELGLLNAFLKLPHQELSAISVRFGDSTFKAADFRHVPGKCKFVALMPQWDFLNFLSEQARRFPGFELLMEHEATDVTQEGERVTGVVARTPQKAELSIRANLVVGCDGRHSVIRKAAGVPMTEYGVPIDVLWFRISRRPDDPQYGLGNINYGKALILIPRGDYFQAGLIIQKGSFDHIKSEGLEAFRESLVRIAPYLADRVGELRDWEHVKLLTVQINRLQRWYRPGLLCIGDAAHAMSPAGGVGINLAVQDALAAANLLARPLRQRHVTRKELAAVQKRREFPTRVTQAAQVRVHRGFARVFQSNGPLKTPWQVKLVMRIPGLQSALGYAVGMGVRAEHVREEHKGARNKAFPKWLAIGMLAGLAAAALAASRSQRR